MPRIGLIGGYTAGHVFPMLAAAEAFRAHHAGAELLFIGGRDSLEATLIRSHGYTCHEIDGAPLYGVTTRLGRLRSYGAFLRGFVQGRRLLARERVDLALGFGGYITAGPMLAARSLGIATGILEANVIPGRANRLVHRWMDIRLIAFPETAEFPGWRQSEVVGYPLRPEIAGLAEEARTAPAGRVARVIVTGGSRGSAFLNRAAPDLLAHVGRLGIALEVIHQTGLEAPEPVAHAYRAAAVKATVEGFTADMAQVYARADLIICAAGAGTLAEIAAMGLPALIVPISRVADDHQVANARVFARRTGAIWANESDWDEAALATSVSRLLQDSAIWDLAVARMREAAVRDAASAVVSACARLLAARR
ncbi:MAG TPA: UDP-N-acetylglucosamine--N-acetylmuramyl-(pentapeptide) pyrophosphoryl-undecaprenol N-acetylglucosamine transferase [Stellaceae bacterium]|nr:UDP-N-acetylglucosamine--N-acetylmuramyl-(pentapeptide) pyrophosphoryl-undecaprenol N-acetylglucosamine transferase [Stellaceae bacterium]